MSPPRIRRLERDGLAFRLLAWPVEEPVGRVQIVHGLNEQMGRYGEVAQVLNRAGYSVFGHDQRGHGDSGGRPGVVGSIAELLADLHWVREQADAVAAGPDPPVLLGHSLGGLLSVRYIQENPGGVPWAILSAPWLGNALALSIPERILVGALRRVAPDLPIPRTLPPELLTDDPARQEAVRADPLFRRVVSVGFLDRAARAQERARALGVPDVEGILLLVPGEDRLVDARATRAWAASGDGPVQVVEIPGCRHEPFNDTTRNTTFQRIVDWLARRRGGVQQEDR